MIDPCRACAELQSLSMLCQSAIADRDWERVEQLMDRMSCVAEDGRRAADERRLEAIGAAAGAQARAGADRAVAALGASR